MVNENEKIDFLDFTRKYLDRSGLGPNSPKYTRFISLLVLLPMCLLLFCFAIYDFRFIRNDVTKTADVFESLATFGQALIRKFILTVHAKLIQDVFKERGKFWDYDTFGELYGNYLRGKMIFATTVTKAMMTLVSAIILLMCLAVIFDKNKKLPVESWTPDNETFCVLISVMQVSIFVEVVCFIGAVDAYYFLMCYDIKIQFLLLRRKLREIRFGFWNDKECLNELKGCCKHHNLLLRIHKKLNRVFSEYFLVQYFLNVLAASVQLYVIIYARPSIEDVLKSIVYLVSVCLQVAMFYMTASEIEKESENLADEIYYMNWEDSSSKQIRQEVLFMLMKAQEPLCMLGGGMVHANRNEYLVVFRLSFSIATLFGGMNKK